MSDRDVGRFDRWSSTYDRSPAQRLFFSRVHERVWDVLAAGDAPPHRVLDAGCGTGRLLGLLRERLPDAELIGVDPAAGMIREAQRRFAGDSRVRLEVAPARSLPVEDGSVDAVTSSISFHHWDEQGASLREVARVLRPGGRMLIADILQIGVLGPVLRHLGHRHGRGYRSWAELTTMVSAAGLVGLHRHRLFAPGSALAIVEAHTPQR